MTEEEIMNKIIELVSDRFEVSADTISASTNFKNDLEADSIDLVEFVLELEDEFGNEIPDEDAENISTIGEAAKYIKNHQ